MIPFFRYFLLLSVLLVFLGSCASKKEVVYFQNAAATGLETKVKENLSDTKFKVVDLIGIFVSTLNPEASLPFNLFRGPQNNNGTLPEQVDYLVDGEGEIDFPVIGKIKVIGLSPEELRVKLTEKLSDYLKNPIINIRLKNFTITVLGEVRRPGNYQVIGEQITILEALGLAGDMTIKGMRNNVLVIREYGGTKIYNRIDLTSSSAAESPVYYLTQNDVVYVEPNKSAITASALDNRASIVVSIASVLITSTVLLITRN